MMNQITDQVYDVITREHDVHVIPAGSAGMHKDTACPCVPQAGLSFCGLCGKEYDIFIHLNPEAYFARRYVHARQIISMVGKKIAEGFHGQTIDVNAHNQQSHWH